MVARLIVAATLAVGLSVGLLRKKDTLQEPEQVTLAR